MKSHKKPQLIGRHIVTDLEICHGKPTFRGTRILVAHVLEQVAEGLSWEVIVQEWRSSISYEAIAEAIRLAIRVFLEPPPDVPPPINATSSFLTEMLYNF